MSMTDPVADMLTRIRNASIAKLKIVDIPHSKLKETIANILKNEGYIKDSQIMSDNKDILRIELIYHEKNKECIIQGLRKISKPGKRVYVTSKEIPKVLNGLGIAIISTDKGVLTDRECKRLNVGGEVLCYIW